MPCGRVPREAPSDATASDGAFRRARQLKRATSSQSKRENANADKLADSDTGDLQARHFLAGPCGKDFLNIGVSSIFSCAHADTNPARLRTR